MKQLQEIEKLIKPYYHEWQTEVDISAVLKYIEKNTGEQVHSFIEQDKIIYEYESWNRSATSIDIPNKPLSLYSPEEELELLELLLKLKQDVR